MVFADIEGFTALAEQRDPESVKELLDACFGRLVPVIDTFGGHVDKIIGDEVMAVFGAPIAHEDDPERAVRAALALAPALAEVNPLLRLRVGVNTGEVMAGAVGPSSGYTVTGDVVNTAHRLAAEAEPGEVLVGERTRHATAVGVAYELRGDLDLKGKQEPVRAWVAKGVQARPMHRNPDGSVSPLVGRSREVAELRRQTGTPRSDCSPSGRAWWPRRPEPTRPCCGAASGCCSGWARSRRGRWSPRPARPGPGRSTRTLDALDPEAASELVLSVLAGHTVDAAPARMGPIALDRLVTAAAGNPLLVDQLVRYLVESGALAERDGRWRWTTDEEGNEADLPDGVRSLIGARLDALPADERLVVSYASVFGRRFWRDALADLGGMPDVDTLLERLAGRGLTQEIRDEGYGDHAFRHVLTRDVAYASLPIGDRATRHARVAAWLERHFEDSRESAPIAQLAHHYERAVVLARAVDHTDPGLSGAAFSALVRAARDEHRRHGLRRADHWYRRARDLGSLDPDFDPDVVLDAVAEHGTVLLELRQLDAAQDAFEELHRRAGSRRPAMQATAAAHLGAVARLLGDVDLARERFDLAAATWRSLGDRRGEVDMLRLQGWSEITVGRARAALPRFPQAEALEEQLDEPARRGETLRYLGWCEFLAGEPDAARAHLWSGMSYAHDADDQGSVGWCFGLLATSSYKPVRHRCASMLATTPRPRTGEGRPGPGAGGHRRPRERAAEPAGARRGAAAPGRSRRRPVAAGGGGGRAIACRSHRRLALRGSGPGGTAARGRRPLPSGRATGAVRRTTHRGGPPLRHPRRPRRPDPPTGAVIAGQGPPGGHPFRCRWIGVPPAGSVNMVR